MMETPLFTSFWKWKQILKVRKDGKRKKEEKKQKKEDDEIVQLNDMTKEQCDKYKGRTLIGIDPVSYTHLNKKLNGEL